MASSRAEPFRTSIRHRIPKRPTLQKTNKVRVIAVKLNGEGWVGVSTIGDRCLGHAHETPELARLCALHREGALHPGQNVLLMPVPKPVG